MSADKIRVSKVSLLIVMLFAVVFLLFTGWKTDWHDLLLRIRQLDFYWLLVAVLSITLYWIYEAKILQIITSSLYGRYSFMDAFRVTMIGQFFNVVTPFATGGQPAQLYTMTRQKVGPGSAGSILMLKFIVYQIVLTLYSLILIIWKTEFFQKRMNNFFYLIFVGFVINVSVIALLFIFTKYKRLKEIILIGILNFLTRIKILKKYQYWKNKIDHNLYLFHQDIAVLKEKTKLLIIIILYTILQLNFFFLVPYFIYRSFGLNGDSIFIIIAATAFVMMITSFVPVPGASGGAELSFYYFFNLFFLKKDILLAILLWRLINYYSGMIVGGLIMLTDKNNL